MKKRYTSFLYERYWHDKFTYLSISDAAEIFTKRAFQGLIYTISTSHYRTLSYRNFPDRPMITVTDVEQNNQQIILARINYENPDSTRRKGYVRGDS
jgi:hypothetical protein